MYKKAALVRYNEKTRDFTFQLSEPYFKRTLDPRTDYVSSTFRVHSTMFMSSVFCSRDTTLKRVYGRRSHTDLLADFGYRYEVFPDFVESLNDEYLLVCMKELQKAGDDVSVFMKELDKR